MRAARASFAAQHHNLTGAAQREAMGIYSMHMSVDGYVEDEHGRFDFTAPDEEVNPYINQLTSSVGTYLYGRTIVRVDGLAGDHAHGCRPPATTMSRADRCPRAAAVGRLRLPSIAGSGFPIRPRFHYISDGLLRAKRTRTLKE